ncbi:hypothetical protein ZIOFF_008224 [Zingiber officinale]|uniref:Uncharacterized protein n=1 Tax=Zingiber officinale TaxID=94328 RepID=A0A8J5HVV4_ZINOF|nr:hypothetical protein ZIOFF_008224 [Zingiber officinale]
MGRLTTDHLAHDLGRPPSNYVVMFLGTSRWKGSTTRFYYSLPHTRIETIPLLIPCWPSMNLSFLLHLICHCHPNRSCWFVVLLTSTKDTPCEPQSLTATSHHTFRSCYPLTPLLEDVVPMTLSPSIEYGGVGSLYTILIDNYYEEAYALLRILSIIFYTHNLNVTSSFVAKRDAEAV